MNVAKLKTIPTAWLVLIVVDIGLVALAYAQDRRAEDVVKVTQIEGPNDVAEDAVRFEAVDVFVDSGDTPLAAYQCELSCSTPGVEIAGIEGGEHKAFASPPYYDPKAMTQNRVKLAAFNTGNDLPSGRSRVARVHVRLEGPGQKEYQTRLTVAATTDGEQIPATLSIAGASYKNQKKK